VSHDCPDQPALGAAVKAIREEKNISQVALVSADTLVFDESERSPDDDLRLQFEATTRLSDKEKRVVKTVIESIPPATRPSTGPHERGRYVARRDARQR
jgi:hypothetical protein